MLTVEPGHAGVPLTVTIPILCPFTPTAKKERSKKEITEMKILRTGSLCLTGL